MTAVTVPSPAANAAANTATGLSAPAIPATPTDRRTLLLHAALENGSPAGGPVLTSAEIALLRRPMGAVAEAVLQARLAQWLVAEPGTTDPGAVLAAARQAETRLELLRRRAAARDDDDGRILLTTLQALRQACVAAALDTSGADPVQPRARGHESPVESLAGSAAPAPTAAPARSTPGRKLMHATLALLVTAAALVVTWVLTPGQLQPLLPAPSPAALTADLALTRVRVVGDMVYADTLDWKERSPTAREQAATAALERAQQLGFAGLVLFDGAAGMVWSRSHRDGASANNQPTGDASQQVTP